ncbi:MAG: hypothetical protein LQ351_000460 [Letrouitia transgressa]|nr:MAG: hypothetical protein LQ351_000460 [Letrouitia transgressa]
MPVLGANLSKRKIENEASKRNDSREKLSAKTSLGSANGPTVPAMFDENPNVNKNNAMAAVGLLEHHFLCLSQYSAMRAFLRNANILALDPEIFIDDDSLSPWTTDNPFTDPVASFPHTLSPTPLQLRSGHHPFVDVIASPTLRDNILLAVLNDEQEELLCYYFHGGDGSDLMIWGSQPWSPFGWEVSQRFVDTWGWLLDHETVRNSDFWRRERGEPPLRLPKWLQNPGTGE